MFLFSTVFARTWSDDIFVAIAKMATIMQEKWTREQIIKLIQGFRDNRILWDENDRDYYLKQLKPAVWGKIGEPLGKSPEECRHKMMILMSAFRRERAKIGRAVSKGSENYTSSWFAFKHMQFLMNKSKKKDKKRKAEDTEENEEEIPEQSNSNTASTIDEQIKVKFERMETTPPRHKESSTSQCQIYDTDFTDNASHDITNATSTEKDEELKAFTTFIYRKMKQYPEAIKNLVQQEICQVVFKADAMCQKTTTWEENNIIKDPEVNVSNESEDSITIKEEIYDIVND